jgi:RNA polymerase sigma-70 factor (ECF subfamily)
VGRQRLEELYRDHGRDVLAYALRRADRATAEDVAAEVFVVAWRRADRVPAQDPLPWLYGVARRLLANERRAARRRGALTFALRGLRRLERPEPHGEVVAALAALRAADREVLMLTAWEGLDARQAAAVLGCTPQAVHTRLHRARGRLEAELARGKDPASVPAPVEVRFP